MAPRKVIPIPEKTLRKSTKAIADNVTIQPTAPNFNYDQYVQKILHPKSLNAGNGNGEKGRIARVSR